jgi:hypothetical protein
MQGIPQTLQPTAQPSIRVDTINPLVLRVFHNFKSNGMTHAVACIGTLEQCARRPYENRNPIAWLCAGLHRHAACDILCHGSERGNDRSDAAVFISTPHHQHPGVRPDFRPQVHVRVRGLHGCELGIVFPPAFALNPKSFAKLS